MHLRLGLPAVYQVAREVPRGGSLFFAGVSPPWQGFSWRKVPSGLVPLNAREVAPRGWGVRDFRCILHVSQASSGAGLLCRLSSWTAERQVPRPVLR